MSGRLLVAGLAILVPLTGHAATIKQKPYDFNYEVARSRESDTFVIGTGCTDDCLSILPVPPRLAVRMSMAESQPHQIVRPKEPAENLPPVSKRRCVSCLMGTVHFPLDSAEITQQGRATLDELVPEIGLGNAVNLNGFTCDLGSSSHNLGLSLRRAKSVASYLKRKGVSIGKVSGLGECCPVSNDKRLNRRVEISTERKEEK